MCYRLYFIHNWLLLSRMKNIRQSKVKDNAFNTHPIGTK